MSEACHETQNDGGIAASERRLWEKTVQSYRRARRRGTDDSFPITRIIAAIVEMRGMKMSNVEIGERFGQSAGWVSYRYMFTKLVPEVIALMDSSRPPGERLLPTDAMSLNGVPRAAQLVRALNLLSARKKRKERESQRR